MKKKLFFAGLILIVLALGIILVGCKGDNGPNLFVGTWTEVEAGVVKLVFTDTTWKYDAGGGAGLPEGTYTYSGNNAVLNLSNTKFADARIDGNTLIYTTIGSTVETFEK
jgi:hypothetical protein